MNLNNGVVLRGAGLQPTQCSYCQLDPYTGEHVCDCHTQDYLAAIGYGSPQQVLVSAASCNCLQCPYQIFLGGGAGLLNGGFQLTTSAPLNMGFGVAGGLPVNPSIAMGQAVSPFTAAGICGAGTMGTLGQGNGAQNSQRMLTYPMMSGMNRRGFGRGVNQLGISSIHGGGRWGRSLR